MEKYLKKSVKQLKQEMLEMTQALEKIRQEKIQVYGEIFLNIVESIDDVKRAEAYLKILDANASKAQKKILAEDIIDLKKLAGIVDKPSVNMNSSRSLETGNSDADASNYLASNDKKVDEVLNENVVDNG